MVSHVNDKFSSSAVIVFLRRSAIWRFFVGKLTNHISMRRSLRRYHHGVKSSWDSPIGGLIPISNSSGGLLKELLINPFLELNSGLRVLLVSEPSDASRELSDWAQAELGIQIKCEVLEDLLGEEWSSQESSYDLSNLPLARVERVGRWDLVVCQSLLEHVLDPVGILDKLVLLAKPNGVVAIQTVNVFMDYHPYPIDCLRFYKDFFIAYGSKRGFSVEAWERQASVFATIRT
jgi:hypothetical protein